MWFFHSDPLGVITLMCLQKSAYFCASTWKVFCAVFFRLHTWEKCLYSFLRYKCKTFFLETCVNVRKLVRKYKISPCVSPQNIDSFSFILIDSCDIWINTRAAFCPPSRNSWIYESVARPFLMSRFVDVLGCLCRRPKTLTGINSCFHLE